VLEARQAVRTLPAYHPPVGARDGLRLDFNENTVGCSPRVLAHLRQLTTEDLARYPEREAIEAVVASRLGLEARELLITNGVDEGIHLLCETFLERGDEVLIVVPTFAMYEIFAAATGAKVITVPAGENFCFPTTALRSRLTPRTRLIAVANPNNPTGVVVAPADLLEIARRAPQAALLVDEAYFEFYGQTLLPRSRHMPNLFVARTFSKAYGMAGFRVGALVGAAAQMAMVRRISCPYNVNGMALACLPAALDDNDYVQRYVAQVRAGRAQLQTELRSCGIPFWPSQANFVLARLGPMKSAFVEGMRRRSILVRDRSGYYGCDGCVRITIGTSDHTARLLEALREVFEEIGATEAGRV
jgi:histidinol-phosphate aminotransferase